MIDLNTNFGILTASKTQKANFVSNPISNSFSSFSSNNSIFSQTKDKKEYQMENNQVAYANPFSFESLFGGNQDSSVSAFDA